MDWERVTVVGSGSGYLVRSDLVLTAAHVVEGRSTVDVFRPGRPEVVTGSVVWSGTPGGRDDAALISVPPFADVDGPVRWGRAVTRRPGVRWESWGSPEAVQRGNTPIEVSQPSGHLNPGDRLVGNRYVLGLDRHRYTSADSPWAGMSGAAAFSGDLLIGVVAIDPAHSKGELLAVPAYALWHDPRFRAALGYDGRLEPVELTGPRRRHRRGPASTPAALLVAGREVVPWQDRPDLMAELKDWLAKAGPGVWLLHGPGGQGKTRLAMQLARDLEPGWCVSWLSPELDVSALGEIVTPTLLVVDYAEANIARLHAVFDELPARRQVKVLLLARTAGTWWEQLRQVSDDTADLLDLAITRKLEPPAVTGDEQYREVVAAFAAALPEVRSVGEHQWHNLADTLTAPTEPAASVLELHMTALADLLDAADLPHNAACSAEDRVLNHELRYWHTTAVDLLATVTSQTLHDVMAVETLFGADDESETTLRLLPALADQPTAVVERVEAWSRSLFPDGGMQPDRLAEHFVGKHLLANPRLGDRLARHATEAQAETMLTVLARAAAHHQFASALDEPLTALCQADVAAVRAAAVVAHRVERPGPLIAAVAAMVDARQITTADLEAIAERIPFESHLLGVPAARATARVIAALRTGSDPAEVRARLARNLTNQSARLLYLGENPTAMVAAAEEAVLLYRELSRTEPRQHTHSLVAALANLAMTARSRSSPRAALDHITEAVNLQRGLARSADKDQLALLATCLSNQAVMLADSEEEPAALAAITDAVDILRALHRAEPERYRRRLASALRNRATLLDEVGELAEAIAVNAEAVAIRRDLVEEDPSRHLPELADVLLKDAALQSAAGKTEAALTAIIEAEGIFTRLAQERHGYQSKLARALHILSVGLSTHERFEEAAVAAERAVVLRRDLAGHGSVRRLRELAEAHQNLADRLWDLGRVTDGVAAAEEAVRLQRQLGNRRDRLVLARALAGLSLHLDTLDRANEGLTAVTEAVDLLRELVAEGDVELRPGLAHWLHNQAIDLYHANRLAEAIAAADQSVTQWQLAGEEIHQEELTKAVHVAEQLRSVL
ncbi:trypsin-like peptidase domain-containing protein [Amycolatopsis sp. NPDC051758]|uniref:P-loop NTPase n=1 Tax=Amycolatopsis sp. NPDC051758 TaxID=3363935 RepID=UPI0037B543CC